MKITFVEKKLRLYSDVKEYAEKKISKLDKFFKTESEAVVCISQQGGKFLAELTIKNNGMFYRVSELTSDIYASIDSAVAGIERQIRKNKTRLEKRLRDGAFEREIKEVYVPDVETESEEEFNIVRNKRFVISPMTVDEAILQMNLLEHDFFTFRNADDDEAFSVVYTRKNGGYGLISDAHD